MIPLFDAHCDTASAVFENGLSLRKNGGHIDLERGRKYSPRAQFFAIFNEGGKNLSDIEGRFSAQLAYFKNELQKNSDIVSLCTNAEEAETAFSSGKTAAFLSVEGAEQLFCDPERLEWAYSAGIRAINITWNYANELSGSNIDKSDMGLTDKGREFVRECQRLGIIVDVSHISEKGFWDIIHITQKPIIASHSNSYAVCPHTRNLTDDQFRAIKDCGGVAGINFYSDFIGENPTIYDLIGHFEHFLSMHGEKNLAIGADFDGCDFLPRGINGVEDVEKVYTGLIQRGFSKALLEDIFLNNLMRVLRF